MRGIRIILIYIFLLLSAGTHIHRYLLSRSGQLYTTIIVDNYNSYYFPGGKWKSAYICVFSPENRGKMLIET